MAWIVAQGVGAGPIAVARGDRLVQLALLGEWLGPLLVLSGEPAQTAVDRFHDGERAVGEKLGLPVVDGVGAAVKPAEALVGLGLRTSRVGSFARPVPKRRDWSPPAG